jgi:excisionase family DNA binding protein
VPPQTSPTEILTIKEVASYLKVTERTIYRLAGAKKIPAFKVGGTWRFSRIDIARWIARQSTSKPEHTMRGKSHREEQK